MFANGNSIYSSLFVFILCKIDESMIGGEVMTFTFQTHNIFLLLSTQFTWKTYSFNLRDLTITCIIFGLFPLKLSIPLSLTNLASNGLS